MNFRHLKTILFLCAYSFLFGNCSSPLIETEPEVITDTSEVSITCNAEKGNKALMGYAGPVYVHLGLITDSSGFPTDWRYVKFKWGSTEKAAEGTPQGKNKWSYKIHNMRNFFGVPGNEKIIQLAILFRSGNCIDTFCKVLRNADKSDVLIPVKQKQ